MLNEFKKFISRGNVLDLAVGVIIGSAFSGIVTSLVNNIFTPLIGIIFGGVDFSGLSITIRNAQIMYGAFLQSVFDFLITAVCLFIIVKIINKINNDLLQKTKKKNEEEKVEVPKKSDDIILLEEIRDLLKDNNKKKGKSK
ncbi:MAG: large conductance mechanosensitive channel protein MscL [Firmicutes bacterium]|nr:large conductance mechanosensitive channel protein MscL [Bacillota bacterium]